MEEEEEEPKYQTNCLLGIFIFIELQIQHEDVKSVQKHDEQHHCVVQVVVIGFVQKWVVATAVGHLFI